MATGDQQDILSKLKGNLPTGWFGGTSLYVDAVLSAFAQVGAFIYTAIQEAVTQSRIKTATYMLDMVAGDFFGTKLIRRLNETDTSYRARIYTNLFRERATRYSVVRILTDLTGAIPSVFEPRRSMDTKGYNATTLAYNTIGAGGYGALGLPHQAFVTAYRPIGTGIPNVGGYGSSVGGYNTPSQLEYTNFDMVINAIKDSDIYGAVEAVKPIGTTVWVKILNS